MSSLTTVILAAGESRRMRSRRPKALHGLGGRLLIDYPVRLARGLGARVVLVVGRGAAEVRAAVGEAPDIVYVEQKERFGTGHAVLQAREACGAGPGAILVLPGDQPLMSQRMLAALVEHHRKTAAAATLLTALADDPTGYGRVVREAGRPVAIVEHRDATAAQRQIREIGTSVYCFDAGALWSALGQVKPQNEQGEYYLTDVISILARNGARVEAVEAEAPEECMGINDRKQLAQVATVLRRRVLERLMEEGVTVLDPAATYVDDRVTLRPYCVLTDTVVEADAQLGPFCHLRPLAHVGAGAKIGNFVELKKSRIGRGGKVPHLSYVGDATVGADVNVGAGTITCNYDGVDKHETVIGAGAFIG